MKTGFRKSFTRDLKKVKDRAVLEAVRQPIEAVEAATGPQDVPGLKKLGGADEFFRIRVGEYRLGVAIDGDLVVFVRCLARRDLYRFFP
jgi:mRNA interferase RelE/StbE